MKSLFRHNIPPNPCRTAMRAAYNKLGPENSFTSLVAYYLHENPVLARKWADFLLSHVVSQCSMFDTENPEISVQPYTGNDQPDMAMTLGKDARILFEHKLDSSESQDQVERYLRLCAEEKRHTGISHYLAFVAPAQHNLVASCYASERFITIGDRHPLWSDLGDIVEKSVAHDPSLLQFYDLFKYLFLLPYHKTLELKPLLMENPIEGDLTPEALSARRGFQTIVHRAAVRCGWETFAFDRKISISPHDGKKFNYDFSINIYVDVCPHRRVIAGEMMPYPSIILTISLYHHRNTFIGLELEGLEKRFGSSKIFGFSPVIPPTHKTRRTSSSRDFEVYFPLREIWEKGDIEKFLDELVKFSIGLFDPPTKRF